MKRIIAVLTALLMISALISCDVRPGGVSAKSGESGVPGGEEYIEYDESVPDTFIKNGNNGEFEYALYGRHAEITAYIGSDSTVRIPAGIEKRKVTVIAENAFSDRESLHEVSIPDTVEIIGNRAFNRCFYLTKVVGGANVRTIGDNAFAFDARLSEFEFGSKIESIGDTAFTWCTSLERIFIPAACDTVGYRAFLCCTGAKELVFEDGELASIGKEAFMCLYSITSLCYPYTTVSMGDGVFKHEMALTEISFNPRVTKIVDCAFQHSHAIESVVIPEHITHMGTYSFGSCKGLKDCTVENSKLVFITADEKKKESQGYVFLQIEGLTLHGKAGSTTEKLTETKYAVRNGWVFKKN